MSIKPRCFIRRKVLIKRNVNKAKFSSILKTDFISLVIILSGGGGRGYNCNKTLFKRNCVATVILQFLSIRPTLKKKKKLLCDFPEWFCLQCNIFVRFVSSSILPIPSDFFSFLDKVCCSPKTASVRIVAPFPAINFFPCFLLFLGGLFLIDCENKNRSLLFMMLRTLSGLLLCI